MSTPISLAALVVAVLVAYAAGQTDKTALYLQPDPFAVVVLDALRPLRGRPFRISDSRPVIQLWDGSELPLGYYIGPLYNTLVRDWKSRD